MLNQKGAQRDNIQHAKEAAVSDYKSDLIEKLEEKGKKLISKRDYISNKILRSRYNGRIIQVRQDIQTIKDTL